MGWRISPASGFRYQEHGTIYAGKKFPAAGDLLSSL